MKVQRIIGVWCIIMISILMMVDGVYAKIPEPDNIIYGFAREDAVVTSLKINGVTIASYTKGENSNAVDYYILRVPIDSFDPQEPDTARPGDVGNIYINGETVSAATVTLGERGTIQIVNLAIGDTDRDGVTNVIDKCADTPSGETADEYGCSSSQDGDRDGYTNGMEMAAGAGSDPYNPDSKPEASALTLYKGFNQVSFPAETMYYGNIATLMNALSGASLISKVMVFDQYGQMFDEAGYNEAGQFYGINLSLPSGKGLPGLIVYAKEDIQFIFTTKFCYKWNLRAGNNLVGTPCASANMTAYQLLQKIGDDTVVYSIQRFNADTGKFETASYINAQPAGVNFPISAGEGYFIYMKKEVLGFRP